MLDKIIKNIKWQHALNKFKHHGIDCRVGLDFSIHGEKYISIGDHFRGGKHIIIDAYDTYNGNPTGMTPSIYIGNDVTLTDNCYISSINEVIIGDGTLIGNNTFICDNFHGKSTEDELMIKPSDRKLYSKGKVCIGKNVWIGRNVCIMPNVVIGDYSVIGANSVVTHNIPSKCIAAGVPAREVKRI